MKRVLIAFLFASVVLVSCGEDDDTSINPAETCIDTDLGLGSSCDDTFTSCCTTTNCYYLWNGNRYNCSATDCTGAAQDLTEDILAGC